MGGLDDIQTVLKPLKKSGTNVYTNLIEIFPLFLKVLELFECRRGHPSYMNAGMYYARV